MKTTTGAIVLSCNSDSRITTSFVKFSTSERQKVVDYFFLCHNFKQLVKTTRGIIFLDVDISVDINILLSNEGVPYEQNSEM